MANFERLDVYKNAVAFVQMVAHLTDRPAKGFSDLLDQLRRSSASVPLNIAEGVGRRGKDQQQHFSVARGSTMECVAILDVGQAFGLFTQEEVTAGKDILEREIEMLSAMIRRGI